MVAKRKGSEIFSLQGKTAIVTGATGYLGCAMIQNLAEAGACVLINGRNIERVKAQVDVLIAQGLNAEAACFDVTDAAAIANYFDSLKARPLDILINNAYFGGAGNISCSNAAAYVESYHVAVVAAHNMLTNSLPLLRSSVKLNGEASVINMASMYGMVSPNQQIYDSAEVANPPFYGTAKAALIQWTKYAACEYGKEKIRVNAISPGAFPSDSVQATSPEFITRLEQKIPMARVGLAEELRGPILFLASSASSYVNGANLVVDGGWTCW